ncbi:MAG: transcriptional repressor [Lachnospiraceae bacterium]|nr:transcriptional repressor [Lachnospiraceae bacterium]
MKALKYSRQRESIKNSLAGRCDHPTADALYASIREEFPNISLGTVYRNLNLLVELGEIQKLSLGDGADHFDGRITPHYHFVCRCCNQVSDLPMSPMEEINTLAQRYSGGKVESHITTFYGICETCCQKKS